MGSSFRSVQTGRTDIVRVGRRERRLGDLYHYLLVTSWPRFMLAVLVLYALVNAIFALAYLACGDGLENARPGNFWDAYFFSVQTLATIGYGKMAPQGLAANVVVTLEALSGMLGFALATGLVFAKFARPTARVLWSKVAVVTEFDGKRSLMFRMANERVNQIVEAQIRVVLARNETTPEGHRMRRFHDLALSRSRTTFFALTWTIIHVLDESSPLHGMTPESLDAQESEIIASVIGTDETFAQAVHARHSYVPSEIVWDARFVDVLSRTPDGRRQIDYSRFHDVEPVAKH